MDLEKQEQVWWDDDYGDIHNIIGTTRIFSVLCLLGCICANNIDNPLVVLNFLQEGSDCK